MKRISKKAALSATYTNHCVRATVVQRLVDAGVPETTIIATTGHKQVQSLAPYASRNSDARKSEMAAILDMQPLPAPAPQAASRTPIKSVTAPVSSSSALESDENQMDDIDTFIATYDLDKAYSAQPTMVHQAKSLLAMKGINLAGAHFGNHYQVHFHM